MARKNVRFNYFEVRLVPAVVAAQEDYENPEEVAEHGYGADPWDMTDLLDYYAVNRNANTTIPIHGDPVEIEPGTLLGPDDDVRSFQLTKMRETNVPSKKRIGQVSEEIRLADDEYIGEFVSILYDRRYCTMMVQSNRYCLSTRQIENYLTELRKIYNTIAGLPNDETPLVVRLAPIVDLRRADSVLRAMHYRKITIRGSDAMMDAALNNDDSIISQARRLLGKCQGASFEITVSMSHAPRTRSLDHAAIRELIEEYRTIPDAMKPSIDIVQRREELEEIEVINLLEPRISDLIPIEMEPRQPIGHEFLYALMREKYLERRAYLARVLAQIE